MDDLKLYGRNPDQLDVLLHTVRIFTFLVFLHVHIACCWTLIFGKLSYVLQGRTWRISWVGSFSALVDLPVRSFLMNLFIN